MEKIKSINPSTEEVLEEIEVAGADEVKESVEKARKASILWGSMDLDERIEWLKKLVPIIEKKKEEIEKNLNQELTNENFSVEITGSTLGDSFYRQMLVAIGLAFILMAIVVFIAFCIC